MALAYWIIHSLEAVTEDEDVVDTAWRKEIRARVEAIKSGRVQMIPAEEMWKDILGVMLKQAEYHPVAKSEMREAASWYDNKIDGLGLDFLFEVKSAGWLFLTVKW